MSGATNGAAREPKFQIAFPVYTLINVERHDKMGLLQSLVPLRTVVHGKHIAIFATQDLAQQFRETTGMREGYGVATLITPKALRAVLLAIESEGCQYVAVYLAQPAQHGGRYYPIRDLIEGTPHDSECSQRHINDS